MKILNPILVILLFYCSVLNAQSYIGYLSDNYSGIHGVISNPAHLADSRFRTDINLIGSSAFLGNDFVKVNLNRIFENDDQFVNDEGFQVLSPKDKNNFFSNFDILGPSFMFNLNDKSTIALFSRGRFFASILGVSGELLQNTEDEFNDSSDFTINNNDFNYSVNGWSELGASYAQEIMNKGAHYLKVGGSLKFLQGYGNVYGRSNNVSVDFDADGISPTEGSITTSGTISYGNSDGDNLEDNFSLINEKNGSGFGADLGLVYEWRPNYNGDPSSDKDLNKYKLKLGFSLTDLGSITYKNGVERAYDITGTVSESSFNAVDDLEDRLSVLYNEISSSSTTKAILPTAAHLDVDYFLKKSLYLNLSTTFSLISQTKVNASSVRSRVSVIPRFETKWFSFYSPISFFQYSGFQWGAGLRAGPIYVGSGSVLSLLINDKSKAADAYAGLKVPLYHSKPRDKDDDGVINKLDDCKREPGPAGNHGCPWPDSDDDGVFDKDDKCPDEKGETDNNGCPWGDKDGDTLLDHVDDCPEEAGTVENNGCPEKDSDGDSILDKNDNCPEEAGPIANNGCPEKDSDGDTVIDKNDNCPEVKGTPENKGCPEVTQEVQNTLNDYAKTILFNTGKSSIKVESYNVLTDIISILGKYPDAEFSIEGHTDNVGSSKNNKDLSESRAQAVMNYFIQNGIDQSRLRAIGFGEDYPISDNTSNEGRALNRRVEINLVK